METIAATKNTQQLIENIYINFTNDNVKYQDLSQYTVNLCAEGVSWSYYGYSKVPLIGSFQGKSGVKKFFESLQELINPLSYSCNEFIIDGDQAVVLGSAKVQVQTTGKEFEHDWCHIYSLENNKITIFRGFTSNPHGMAIAFNKT